MFFKWSRSKNRFKSLKMMIMLLPLLRRRRGRKPRRVRTREKERLLLRKLKVARTTEGG